MISIFDLIFVPSLYIQPPSLVQVFWYCVCGKLASLLMLDQFMIK